MKLMITLRDRVPRKAKRTIRDLAQWPQRLLLDPIVVVLQRRLSVTPTVKGRRSRLKIGRNVSLVNALLNTVSGTIQIGDDTFFGHNCMVLTGTHRAVLGGGGSYGGEDVPSEGNDIVIGRGCWISSGAIILGPVTIGDGAVVAAGAVVRGDVPPGGFAAGVPARVGPRIQRGFGEEEHEQAGEHALDTDQ